jgi:hypothetical protein
MPRGFPERPLRVDKHPAGLSMDIRQNSLFIASRVRAVAADFPETQDSPRKSDYQLRTLITARLRFEDSNRTNGIRLFGEPKG